MQQGVASRKGLVASHTCVPCWPRRMRTPGRPKQGWAVLMAVIEEVEQSEGRFYAAELLSPQRRVTAPPGHDQCAASRSLLAAGSRPGPPVAGEVVGTARRHESRPGSGNTRTNVRTPTTCLPRSMTGSPKDLIPPTSRKPRRSSTSSPPLLERQKLGFSRQMLGFSSGIPVSPAVVYAIAYCLPLPVDA